MKELNDDFSHVMNETLLTAKRVKELVGSIIPHLTLLDLSVLIERTLSSSLDKGTWTLQCEGHPLYVQGDAHLLGTALLELVQNSRDAVDDGEQIMISITIETVRTDEQVDWVTITYRDEGPGIPAEYRERIFEDFFSYHPGRKVGTGLGMGFIRRVIEAHDGVIVTSLSVPGAEFIISIPRWIPMERDKEAVYVSHSNSRR